MHAIDLIATALSEGDAPTPSGATRGLCAVTGEVRACVPRRQLLKKGFTNEPMLKAPMSDMVSVGAYRVLKFRPERGSSWICDGETFSKLRRRDVRGAVLGGKYPTVWAGYATTSYKKHGSLWTVVNAGRSRMWRFEALDVDCRDHSLVLSTWGRLVSELRAGLGRKILELLRCPPVIIKKVGVRRWTDFEKWARPRMASPLYRFLCYLLPSQKELADEN